jgi:hypothetical protein
MSVNTTKRTVQMKDREIANLVSIREYFFDAKHVQETLAKNYAIECKVGCFTHLTDALEYLEKT